MTADNEKKELCDIVQMYMNKYGRTESREIITSSVFIRIGIDLKKNIIIRTWNKPYWSNTLRGDDRNFSEIIRCRCGAYFNKNPTGTFNISYDYTPNRINELKKIFYLTVRDNKIYRTRRDHSGEILYNSITEFITEMNNIKDFSVSKFIWALRKGWLMLQ